MVMILMVGTDVNETSVKQNVMVQSAFF